MDNVNLPHWRRYIAPQNDVAGQSAFEQGINAQVPAAMATAVALKSVPLEAPGAAAALQPASGLPFAQFQLDLSTAALSTAGVALSQRARSIYFARGGSNPVAQVDVKSGNLFTRMIPGSRLVAPADQLTFFLSTGAAAGKIAAGKAGASVAQFIFELDDRAKYFEPPQVGGQLSGPVALTNTTSLFPSAAPFTLAEAAMSANPPTNFTRVSGWRTIGILLGVASGTLKDFQIIPWVAQDAAGTGAVPMSAEILGIPDSTPTGIAQRFIEWQLNNVDFFGLSVVQGAGNATAFSYDLIGLNAFGGGSV